MPFACIFVPDFPAEAILRAAPDLRGQAVAVLEGKPPLQKVFSLNEKARNLGIESGMTKLQAEAAPGVILRTRSLPQEEAAHAALLDCAQSFSPVIEDAGPDTILLDLAGLECLFGPLPKIARDVARRTSDLGIEANVAVASNADAALLAARGYCGVTVIPPGEEAERLGNLPLNVLFADHRGAQEQKKAEEFLETLSRWGVRNLRALAALPEIAVSERLGQKGVRLQKLARGDVSRKLVPIEPPLIFNESAELEYPLLLLEPLALLLQVMLEHLCTRLGTRALATQELRLRLELEQGYLADEATEGCDPESDMTIEQEHRESPSAELSLGSDERGRPSPHMQWRAKPSSSPTFIRTLRLPVPMLDAKIFLKLLQLDLKANPPGAPIKKVHLTAEPARPRNAQSGLFLPTTPQPEKLELTLARIAGIIGADRVGSVELLDTYRPEGFHMRHFVCEPQRQERNKQNGNAETDSDQQNKNGNGAVTALRIFRPPLQAIVTLSDGIPARVICPKRKEVAGQIIWTAGPWRFSGDWWDQNAWARDEWDVALQSQEGVALYRLVRDPLSGKWFVEGSYD